MTQPLFSIFKIKCIYRLKNGVGWLPSCFPNLFNELRASQRGVNPFRFSDTVTKNVVLRQRGRRVTRQFFEGAIETPNGSETAINGAVGDALVFFLNHFDCISDPQCIQIMGKGHAEQLLEDF